MADPAVFKMDQMTPVGRGEGVIEQCAGLHDLVDQPEIERGRWLVCAGAVDDGLEMLRRGREPHDLECDGRERHADLKLRDPDPRGAFRH